MFFKSVKKVIGLIFFVTCTIFQVASECHSDKPNLTQQGNNKDIVEWLVSTMNGCKNSEVEYSSYDGWDNNLGKKDLGSTEQPLLKRWTALKTEKIQAQNWSEAWNEIKSVTRVWNNNLNAFWLFFGRQVIDEILDTKNPSCVTSEYDSNISFDSEQLNYASSYIDGGVIYGRSRYLIEKQIVSRDGTVDINQLYNLKMKKNNLYENTSFFLRIIWLRWHNRIAQQIHKICSEWTYKKVFNEARKWTIAIQQKIYVYEWLPLLTLKQFENYTGYDSTIDTQVEKLFQAAIVIPDSVEDIKGLFIQNSRHKSFWVSSGIDELLNNLTSMPCNLLKENKLEYVQQKYNLPQINQARKMFRLKPYTSWTDSLNITKSNNDLDVLMGETHEFGVLSTVISDQFRRIRDGDRFWFENLDNNLFSCEEVVKLQQITFADIILTVTNNTDIKQQHYGVFVFYESNNTNFDIELTFKNSTKKVYVLGIYFYLAPLVVMVLFGIGAFGIAVCLIARNKIKLRKLVQKEYGIIKQTVQDSAQIDYPLFPVKEYVGAQDALRQVVVILKKRRQQITIQSFSGTILRVIELKPASKTVLKIISLSDEPTLIMQVPHNYDLVLKFESNYLRTAYTTELNDFIASNSMLEKEQITNFNWKSIKPIIVTKEHRQTWLEMFFRVAFAQAFKIQHSLHEMLQVDAFVAKQVIYTELTIVEFADALSMSPDNEFVKRMFTLVDKDKNGFISFREFIDLLIIFANGSKEKKAKLLFDLYDINCTGLIPATDFSAMIKSFFEITGERVYLGNIHKTIDEMLRAAGMEHKKNLDFNDFKTIIGDDINTLNYAKLGFKMQPQEEEADSYLAFAKRTIESMYKKPADFETRFQKFSKVVDQIQENIIRPPVRQTRLYAVLVFLELHSKQLFWMVSCTLLIMLIFIEGICHSNATNRLSGINWYIFRITRGAKYPMVLTYALLFITMCRNILNKYFPFDYLLQFHIYVAYLSAFFTAIHVVAETLIFYEIILTSDACLLNNYLMNQDNFNIHMTFWKNYVVITGVMLTMLLSIYYIFSQPYIRQELSGIFHFIHHLYPLIIIIVIIHGAQSLSPLSYCVMSASLVLYLLDVFVSLQRKKIELPILRAESLPSNVVCLILRRPENFHYKVGQWIRLAVPQISRQQFLPVALSSAPHEPYLQIHVPPTTSWARQVHDLFQGPGLGYAAAPVRVLLDGPYGAGAQHWRLYDVVVLVAGGSGVASFAAMLKDVSHALQSQAYLHCEKVYFIWVAKTQKNFEWIVDLIRETEDRDPKHYLSCHLYITQFYEKFDLRTIVLYICEKHYQKVSGKSLFTNLNAVTHFGRPDFLEFLKAVQSLHPTTKHIGVFSSGPESLYRGIDAACSLLNSKGVQRFEHHSNNKF